MIRTQRGLWDDGLSGSCQGSSGAGRGIQQDVEVEAWREMRHGLIGERAEKRKMRLERS